MIFISHRQQEICNATYNSSTSSIDYHSHYYCYKGLEYNWSPRAYTSDTLATPPAPSATPSHHGVGSEYTIPVTGGEYDALVGGTGQGGGYDVNYHVLEGATHEEPVPEKALPAANNPATKPVTQDEEYSTLTNVITEHRN